MDKNVIAKTSMLRTMFIHMNSEPSAPPSSGNSYFDRILRRPALPAELQQKTLRQANRTVLGRSGREYIETITEKGKHSMDGKYETRPEITNGYEITFSASIENKSHSMYSKPHPKVMSDEMALTIWDAVISSFKPRAGAQ